MRLNVFSGKFTKLHAEILIAGCYEDIRPLGGLAGEIDWLYGGIFSSLMTRNRVAGKQGEILLLSTQGKMQVPKTLLVGLGSAVEYDYPILNEAAKGVFQLMAGLHVRDIAVELAEPVFRRGARRRFPENAGPASPGESESEKTNQFDLRLLMEAFLKGIDEKKRRDPFDLTFVVSDSEKARTLQRRIVNGEYLWKSSPSHSGSYHD